MIPMSLLFAPLCSDMPPNRAYDGASGERRNRQSLAGGAGIIEVDDALAIAEQIDV